MQKPFKFRIYPDADQRAFLARQFGGVRFVYNYFLARKQEAYQNEGKTLTYYDMTKELTALKQQEEYVWLYEIIAQSQQVALKNLDQSYKNFFRRVKQGAKKKGFPKFKKRESKQSIKIRQLFHIQNGELFIPKLKTGIKINQHRSIEGRVISCFISKTPTDKYYVSILCEIEDIKRLPTTDKAIGFDAGLTSLITTSDGETTANPKHQKRLAKKLKYQHRQLSKKQKGGKNRNKARKQLAITYEKAANSRNDFIHKVSKKLIDENQVIIAEKLTIENMVKNHCLAAAIQDAAWGELLRQLTYKAEWYGRTFHQVDRFFPSSKMCSACQFVMSELPLSIRERDCPNCYAHHDRDINAAQNILVRGLTDLIAEGNPCVWGIQSHVKPQGLLISSQEGSRKEKHGEAFSSAAELLFCDQEKSMSHDAKEQFTWSA